MTLDELRQQELLEEIAPDPGGARVIVEACERHLASAALIADGDPSGAFQLAYDAARKAVSAHMLANGPQARHHPRIGGHIIVGRYAAAALGGQAAAAVTAFDGMRRRRNRTEYGVAQIERAEVDGALGHARALVDAVSDALR